MNESDYELQQNIIFGGTISGQQLHNNGRIIIILLSQYTVWVLSATEDMSSLATFPLEPTIHTSGDASYILVTAAAPVIQDAAHVQSRSTGTLRSADWASISDTSERARSTSAINVRRVRRRTAGIPRQYNILWSIIK